MIINKPQVEEKFATNFSKMSGNKEGLLAAILPALVAAKAPPHKKCPIQVFYF